MNLWSVIKYCNIVFEHTTKVLPEGDTTDADTYSKLLIILILICPCIANIIPNYNQQDATFLYLFISTDALHVSGGSSAHHQEHITVHTASGIVNQYCCLLLSWMRWNAVEAVRNVIAHGDAWEGKWRGNRRLERVAITLTMYLGIWSINGLPADPHSSTASSRLNWLPRRFKRTRPFLWKTSAITFQTCSTISSTIATSSSIGWQYLKLYVQLRTLDDGRRNRLKHLERL